MIDYLSFRVVCIYIMTIDYCIYLLYYYIFFFFFFFQAEDGIRDVAVTGVQTCALPIFFSKFAELGSARQVWLWFHSEGLTFPLRSSMKSAIRWVAATYHTIHRVLTNPVYAGAYFYGRSHCERYVDDKGRLRKRTRLLPMAEWSVLLLEHHPSYIDWATFQSNQARLDSNVHPGPHQAGGAVREGAALLQGLATCGKCGRRLHTHYTGRNAVPGYHCAGQDIVSRRDVYCLNVGGVQIGQAVVEAFLKALTPAALEATQLAIRSEEHTSELQSRLHLVCRLLLEKTKQPTTLLHSTQLSI